MNELELKEYLSKRKYSMSDEEVKEELAQKRFGKFFIICILLLFLCFGIYYSLCWLFG